MKKLRVLCRPESAGNEDRMKFRMLALFLCLCLLSGCGDLFGATVVTAGGGEDREAPPLEEPDNPESGDAAEPEPAPEDFFETLPRAYMF